MIRKLSSKVSSIRWWLSGKTLIVGANYKIRVYNTGSFWRSMKTKLKQIKRGI